MCKAVVNHGGWLVADGCCLPINLEKERKDVGGAGTNKVSNGCHANHVTLANHGGLGCASGFAPIGFIGCGPSTQNPVVLQQSHHVRSQPEKGQV